VCLQITVSDGISGETQKTFYIKQEPYELRVSDKKEDTAYKRQVLGPCRHQPLVLIQPS
jgi:hypothetical protein